MKENFKFDLIFITLTFLSAVNGKAPRMLTSLSRRISPMSSLHFLLGLLLLFFYFSLAYCKIRGTRDIYKHSMDIPVPPKLYLVTAIVVFSDISLFDSNAAEKYLYETNSLTKQSLRDVIRGENC